LYYQLIKCQIIRIGTIAGEHNHSFINYIQSVVTVVLVEKLLIFQTTNTGNAGIHTHNITNSAIGGGSAHSNVQPELVVTLFNIDLN
jgi:microcystin-dependent protein